MSDHLPNPASPETRGTVPVQFFEADGGPPPAGTRATPRPADRPRVVPPGDLSPAALQLFECGETPGATAGIRSQGREEVSG